MTSSVRISEPARVATIQGHATEPVKNDVLPSALGPEASVNALQELDSQSELHVALILRGSSPRSRSVRLATMAARARRKSARRARARARAKTSQTPR